VRQSESLYDQIAALLGLKAFQDWREDPDQPKRWADVCEFLEAEAGGDAPERFRQLQEAVKAAMQSCNDRDNAYLTKNPIKRYAPIHIHELRELSDFLETLIRRFPQRAGGGKK
jgi:hypothetical protein